MEGFVDKIILKLDKEGLIKDDPIIYKYGLMLIINEMITALLLILISIPLYKVLHAILYMFCFSYLREYVGGYHANTYMGCRCAYIFLYLINLVFLNYHLNFLYLILTGICILILLFIIPVEFPTKPLSKEDKIIYRQKSLKRICCYCIGIFLSTILNSELSELLCTVFISITILAIIQFCRNNQKGGLNNHEQFDSQSFS